MLLWGCAPKTIGNHWFANENVSVCMELAKRPVTLNTLAFRYENACVLQWKRYPPPTHTHTQISDQGVTTNSYDLPSPQGGSLMKAQRLIISISVLS